MGEMVERKHDSSDTTTGIARDISRLQEAQLDFWWLIERAWAKHHGKNPQFSFLWWVTRLRTSNVKCSYWSFPHFLMEEIPRPDQLGKIKDLTNFPQRI